MLEKKANVVKHVGDPSVFLDMSSPRNYTFLKWLIF